LANCAGNGRVQYDTTHPANIEEQTGINIKQATEMLKQCCFRSNKWKFKQQAHCTKIIKQIIYYYI
jgi:hypothetical protein